MHFKVLPENTQDQIYMTHVLASRIATKCLEQTFKPNVIFDLFTDSAHDILQPYSPVNFNLVLFSLL